MDKESRKISRKKHYTKPAVAFLLLVFVGAAVSTTTLIQVLLDVNLWWQE